MPEINKEEIQHILYIIKKIIPFDKVILFGEFANGKLRSEINGGYEFLIITAEDPAMGGWEVEDKLKDLYHYEIRETNQIHIETIKAKDFNRCLVDSWFLGTIYDEGYIIYDRGLSCSLSKNNTFQRERAFKKMDKEYNYWFNIAEYCLKQAEEAWDDKQSHISALMLSNAANFLLRAEEAVFYGNMIKTSNLHTLFKRCRHYCNQLLKSFPLDDGNFEFLCDMKNYRRQVRREVCFKIANKKFSTYLEKLKLMRDIINASCKRHLYFMENGETIQETKTKLKEIKAKEEFFLSMVN